MNIKFVKTKRNPLNNRLLSAFLGFTFALAPLPYLFSCSAIPAHADAGGYSGFTDYISSYATSGAASGLNSDGWAVLAAYWMCKQCLDNPITSDGSYNINNFIGGSGRYYDASGTVHTGSICLAASGLGNVSDGSLPCFESDEGTITIQNPNGGDFNNYVEGSFTVITCSQTYTLARSTVQGELASINAPIYFGNGGSIPSFPWSTVYRDSFVSSLKRATYKISGAFVTNLPSWDISPASLSVYINEVLNPYLEIQYPDTDVPLYVYEPDYEPVYPSEYVTGIPKDWTIENPQLPTAADLEFEHYEEDLTGFHPIQEIKETVDIIKAMDFWWWLTEKTLDSLNLKIFYVIFLTVGVLIFIVWIIGQ